MTQDSLFDRRTSRALMGLLVFLAAYFILSSLIVSFSILSYPYQAGWMEAAVMHEVQHIVEGKPVYTKPSLAYVPMIYTPLYFYATAAMTYLSGMDFLAGRLVSWLSTLGTCVILYCWIRRERFSPVLGLFAVGCYVSGNQEVIGGFYDFVRVDALFIFFLIAALYVYRFHATGLSAVISGLLFAAAFFTKQQAAIVWLPVMLAGLIIDRRKTLYSACTALGVSLIVIGYQNVSGNWFNFYVFILPSALPFRRFHGILSFWEWDVMHLMPIFFATSIIMLLQAWREDKKFWLFYASFFAGTIAASWLSRLHIGGDTNVDMPIFACMCLLSTQLLGKSRSMAASSRILILLPMACQLFAYLYDPLRFIPYDGDYAADKRYLDFIGSLPGEVFIPDLQFLPEQVGKTSYVYRDQGADIIRAKLPERLEYIRKDYRMELIQALKNQSFSFLLLVNESDLGNMKRGYVLKKSIFKNGYDAFHKVDLPVFLYVSKAMLKKDGQIEHYVPETTLDKENSLPEHPADKGSPQPDDSLNDEKEDKPL